MWHVWENEMGRTCGRLRLKCEGTRAETRFRLSAKRTSPFKSARASVQLWLLAAVVCASAVVMVVMLDTPCSEVVWRVLATHSIRQFPLHFPSRASWCAITFQLGSTYGRYQRCISGFGEIWGKETTWKPWRRRDNIKMDFQAVWGGERDWIDLVQDRDRWRTLVNAVM